jgi:hypothetical protein
MRIAPPGTADETRLAEIERLLAELPNSTDLQFRRACALEDVGWSEAAAAAYAALLEREPRHLGARTNLGLMLHERGDVAGARALLEPALEHYPFAPIAHVNLAAALRDAGDVAEAIRLYRRALELDPSFFAAHHGLALTHEHLGEDARAQEHFARAFAERAWWTTPFAGTGTPRRVLLLVSGRGGDVIAHPFLDDRTIETTMLVPDGVRAGTPLPPHDLVFNAIGDADRCAPALERARVLLAGSTARTINDPARVLRTGRATLAARIGTIDGAVVPRIERVTRASLVPETLAASGWQYPLLLRTPGFHAGRHVARIADAASLDGALASLPGDELFAIAFADTRSADGLFRKYRVVVVGGELLPVHLAISHDWMVHYFSAQMAENDAYRAEERRFLDDPRAALGSGVLATLAAIGAALDLDYGGVDFGIDADGRVVVFEANATMAVVPPERDDRWAYRRPAYDAVVAAMRALIAGG